MAETVARAAYEDMKRRLGQKTRRLEEELVRLKSSPDMWTLDIPLGPTRRAVLTMPVPIAGAELDHLKTVLVANLDMQREALLRRPSGADDGD